MGLACTECCWADTRSMSLPLATRFITAIALVFFVFSGSGCMTAVLWSPKSLEYDYVSGTVALTGNAASSRALVVEYQYSGERSAVLVPLNADGSPQPPFDFQGDKLKVEGYGSKADDKQRAAIFEAALAHANARPSTMTSIISDPNCYCGHTAYFFELDQERDKLLAVVYGIDEKGRVVGLQSITDKPKLPDGARLVRAFIAIVPYNQPRSRAGRNQDRVVAILLTPFSLGLDAALLLPLYQPWWSRCRF